MKSWESQTEKNWGRKPLLRVSLAVVFFSALQVEAGPITFNTGLPVATRQGIFRGQYVLFHASDDPTALDRSVTVQGAPFVIAYGATPRLALFGVVPYLHKSLEVNTPLGRQERTTSGIGDAFCIGRFTAYAVDRPGSTIRIAPFAGIKFPTGEDDASDRLGRLPRPLQLGSGSWDGLGGIVFTWQTTEWEFDADAGYRRNSEADDFRFGDQFFADASFQYRVWPRRLESGVPAFLYAVVESNLVREGRSQVAGIRDPNSGGTRVDIDFGLQYVTARYVIEGVVQIPTVQRLHGTALESDYQLSVGGRRNF